ncbi:MAG: TPM domain-containing protein [Bacteroidetes bacterium]|nr:TPM domain-containing protein [Bacteroidota bacterium]
MKAEELFQEADRARIHQAVHAAELVTSGEIRVFMEDECKNNVLDRAAFIFAQLEMHETDLRNGVLIYLAVDDRKFCIIGDAGIHKIVGNNFWEEITGQMGIYFKENHFVDGIEYAVRKVGEQLSAHFPRDKDDINELPNDIVFGGGGS